MSEGTKAVFLSYASQDSEAAKRIADALRASGLEVWFDAEGGLEHGDEWDAKIRRQIKECVLFLPIISANTQAREEGYFRIEWELAAQRALGIASGVAFILPIVIDDTREPDALVPDRFRTVQWTRLRGGELTPEVKSRFLKLWSHRTGALKHEAVSRGQMTEDGGQRTGEGRQAESAKIPSPGWKIYAGLAVAVFALAAGAVWWLGRREAPVVAVPPAPVVVAGPVSAPQVSEARQLMEKARALYINQLNTSRDDCELAEDLLKQAQGKEANDAEVWASLSQLHSYVFMRGWDLSNQRREAARVAAQRAMRLDPASFEGRLAEAFLLADTGPESLEKEKLLRALRTERPAEKRLLRALGSVLDRRGDLAEADALSDEAAALPGGDPLSLYNKSLRHWFAGNTGRAEASMAAALEQAPAFTGALIFTAWYAAHLHGDLERARATINRVPAGEMREDRPAFFAYFIELLGRQPEAAIARLQAVPRAWIEDNWYRGPKALLVGDALQAGGRPAAAAIEWRSALQQLEEKLSQAPSNQRALFLRAMVLAKLGERAESEKQFKALVERTGVSLTGDAPVPTWVTDLLIQLGRPDEAIPQISRALRRERRAVEYTAATLRLDPKFDPVRARPEFARILAEAEAIEQTAAAAGQAPRVWPKHPELRKAIDLIEGTESIPDDFALAEQIVQPIVDRAPTDLEAVTVMARVQSQFMRRGFDRSDERSARARLYGERALQLDPNEPEAMLAVATYLYSRVTAEARAERLLRRAMELDPANPRHGRILADLLNAQPGRQAEALAQSQQNVRRFPQDALSRYDLARHYKDQGRYEEFDRELDAVLDLTLLPNAVAWKARLQFGLHNDFPGMKRWLDQVPERVRGTERAVFGYFLYAAFGGDTETGLEALRAFTQKWFTDFEYAGPTALLNADLLVRQGKAELARQQYEAAWLEIQRMRTTDPARLWLNYAEFWTLLGLERKTEARQTFRRLVEAQRRPFAQSLFTGWWFTLIPGALLIGERDTALEFLRESVTTLPEGRGAIRVRMQLDPRMAPFRNDPEIVALLAEPGVETVAAPLSEAGKLTTRTVTLYSKLNYTRENLAIAEDLGRKATELEPDSAAAWGARAGVQATYLYRNWDASEKRRQDTQAFASRALGLDPDEPEALLALGHLLRHQGVDDQAIIHFRRALAAAPANLRAARALGTSLSFAGQREEGRAVLLEAVKADPQDALVRYDLALTYDVYFAQSGLPPTEVTTALGHLDAGLAVQPLASLLTAKAVSQGGWLGDVPALRTTLAQLEKLPLAERAEDRSVFVAMWGALLGRDPARAAAAAALTAKNYFQDSVVPRRAKDWSLAIAHRLEGKENLARLDWQRAETVLRQRLSEDPNNLSRVGELATTLAWLGRTDEALQLVAPAEAAAREEPSRQRSRALADFYAALGDAAKAVPHLRQSLNQTVFLTSQTLVLDPWFDKLRGQPEFEALLKEAAKK